MIASERAGRWAKWIRFGDICRFSTGDQLNKETLNEQGAYPVYNGGTTPSGYYSEYNTEADTIAISQGGASAGFVNWIATRFWAGAHCYRLNELDKSLDKRYLYFFLKSRQDKLQNSKQGAGIPGLSRNALDSLEVAVPSLEIQRRIVDVLDNFDAICSDLQIGLPAEIDARRKQYEYYRDLLLNFCQDSENTCPPTVITAMPGVTFESTIAILQYVFGVAFVRLGDVAEYVKTRVSASKVTKETYVGVENLLQDKQGKTESSFLPESDAFIGFDVGDILIGNIRPYLKKIWLANHSGGTNGDVLVVRIKQENLVPEYLYQCLSTDAFFHYEMQHAKGAKMPRGDKAAVMEYVIPLPPLSEQRRIAAILDRFDALCNDLSAGLPAEIDARRKQYEYYRDLLLGFEATNPTP